MAALVASSSAGSTFTRGAPLQSRKSGLQARRLSSRAVTPVKAKYGDESQFFDLDDLEDTAGSWDLYGQQDTKRYPGIQAEFFERAAGPLTRRNSILGIVGLGGVVGIAAWGFAGSKYVKLPIQNGPQKGGEKGPRGKI
ncbi:hypothetical protein WJX84_011179 [Apatococcus fuscideae]|uniref:Uncharacterized protein n=1 Tax=Apatococcus fuscideae TaxID=2026836 RepID=A0AAW1RFT9_9CHLO